MVTPPPLTDVEPGDPISSAGWNNVIGAIRMLVEEANRPRGTVTVSVVDQLENAFRGATVTAQPKGDPPRPARGAVFVGGETNAYQIDGVAPGTYTLSVEATGFTAMPATIEVTVPVDKAAAVATFMVDGAPMPHVLGVPLGTAVAALKASGFNAVRIVDSHGVEVNLADAAGAATSLPVLGQFPIADALAPKNGEVFVHVSAASEVLQRVKMPDLLGLTAGEAKAALEELGLTLGTSVTLGASTTGTGTP